MQVGKCECKNEIYMTTNLTVATASEKWELYFVSCFAAKQTAENRKEVLRLTILRPFAGKQTVYKGWLNLGFWEAILTAI